MTNIEVRKLQEHFWCGLKSIPYDSFSWTSHRKNTYEKIYLKMKNRNFIIMKIKQENEQVSYKNATFCSRRTKENWWYINALYGTDNVCIRENNDSNNMNEHIKGYL